jgi:hypothetical protein
MNEKWLAIGIILLFVGVTITPSISQNIVRASQEDDLVEVTTQACGIQGYGNTTVKLTREQYQNLEEYLVEFRARLNQTTTKVEAISLFKEAVVALDTYGLLPKGMSVHQAQQFVITENHRYSVSTNMERSISGCLNVFCLFTAITYDVVDYNIWVLTAAFLSQFITYNSPFIFLVSLFFFIGFVKPLRVFNMLVVPGDPADVNFYFTLGLRGIHIGLGDIGSVIGFTGLKIWLNTHNAFYLGFALTVNR